MNEVETKNLIFLDVFGGKYFGVFLHPVSGSISARIVSLTVTNVSKATDLDKKLVCKARGPE